MNDKINLATSDKKVPVQNRGNLFIAYEYFSIGVGLLKEGQGLLSVDKTQKNSDEKLMEGLTKSAVGMFNMSHGLELILKNLLKMEGVKAGSTHKIGKAFKNLCDTNPNIIENFNTLFGSLQNEKTDDTTVLTLVQKIEANAMAARYYGQGSPNNTLNTVSYQQASILAISLAVTYPDLDIQRLSKKLGVPQVPAT